MHLIDFGLSEFYMNRHRYHINHSKTDQFIGTIKYASLNSHNEVQLSRRDDIESLGYLLIHICKPGGLPWSLDNSMGEIARKKCFIGVDELCHDVPLELGELVQHAKTLQFT